MASRNGAETLSYVADRRFDCAFSNAVGTHIAGLHSTLRKRRFLVYLPSSLFSRWNQMCVTRSLRNDKFAPVNISSFLYFQPLLRGLTKFENAVYCIINIYPPRF
jgi:hypothetical protein